MKEERRNVLIYGAVIGDIFGSSWEFSNYVDEKPESFDSITFEDGNYTDDTVMTVAVADSLLRRCDVSMMMRSYARTYRCPRGGYGARFYNWLFNPYAGPYGSCGNGAGMRVSSVAYFAKSEEECILLAKQVTEVTHNHPEGLKAAEVLSLCIYRALHGATKEQLKEYISSQYEISFDLEELHKYYKHNETCQKSVPEAFYCFLSSNSFEDCLRRVCYIGGDADTVGAMACALASAFYKEVPEKLLDLVREKLPQHFKEVLDNVPNPEEK